MQLYPWIKGCILENSDKALVSAEQSQEVFWSLWSLQESQPIRATILWDTPSSTESDTSTFSNTPSSTHSIPQLYSKTHRWRHSGLSLENSFDWFTFQYVRAYLWSCGRFHWHSGFRVDRALAWSEPTRQRLTRFKNLWNSSPSLLPLT